MAFYPLEMLSRMSDGYQKAFNIAGHRLLLIQMEGQPYVVENKCPHMGVSLVDATQMPGNLIRCKAHGIEFQLATGKACGPLANTLACLKKYAVAYEGGQLGVDV